MIFCLQNHDQIGNRPFGRRLHHQIDPALFRALSAVLLVAPETPLLFMGQEWAASSPFLYFTDHHQELGRLVTEGRRREFSRFDAFAGIVSSVDAQQAARVYRRLRPLCDAAARELGQPAGEMDVVLGQALATLLAAPVLDGEVAVASEGPFYRFADNRLETLPPSQKQLLRMGPRNERLVQAKLKEMVEALALPVKP